MGEGGWGIHTFSEFERVNSGGFGVYGKGFGFLVEAGRRVVVEVKW